MNVFDKSRNQPVREWIYAGPYDLDVSELYSTNYAVPVEPYLPLMEKAVQDMRDCRPTEGQSLNRFGQTLVWAYKRTDPSEPKMTWARYGQHARLLATYAYNRIIVNRSGTYRFQLWVAGSAVVTINGQEVFHKRQLGRVEGEFRFEAELSQGTNPCMVMLFNVHLHCTNSFMLVVEDTEFAVELPLQLDAATREAVEADLLKFYMVRHVLQRHDNVAVHLDEPLSQRGTWVFSIIEIDRGGKQADRSVRETRLSLAADQSEVGLCGCTELTAPGEYALQIDYEHEDGSRVEGVRLTFHYVSFIDRPAEADFPRRKQFLAELYASSQEMKRSRLNGVYHEFMKLRMGKEVDVQAVEETIQFINSRYDCADFAMHGLLRMYFRYRNSETLPPHLKESMKQCILGFKYWEDEPGTSMMFTRSENHEILFYSAEYLAGLLFPAENFPNSNQNGLFHVQKGKAMAERWIKEKGTYGFMEWHSNTYYEEDMLALLNLYDFAEENSYIRILARQLLDLIGIIVATHSYKGVMGTTHGRCYEDTVIHPELESMGHINWLLFGGREWLRGDRLSIGAAALTDSSYSPDPYLEAIANSGEECHTLTRMGLFPHEGLGGVNCSTYRTKNYMVSGLVESHQGRFGHQVQAGQVLLDGSVPVFVTCFDNKSETTRPSYWGGQYRMPKTIAYKNVLAYIYKIDETAGYTHCYFPAKDMDEIFEAGKWIFGRKNDAYVALYSLKPYTKTKTGKYKDRELLCLEKRNIWLIEAGDRESYGSFEAFIQAVSTTGLTEQGEDILYCSPAAGPLQLGWEETCMAEGKPVPEPGGFPLIRNRYAEAAYGSGLTYLKLGGRQKILNFNM
ncbi:hypothetical protein [Paenibacillus sp. HJGM_3]|uniref:hypothetical protein n=1 Tax=Paenibacillus sp. HJGM_3 TaxID=3379816 RepID=UPI00385DF2FF